MSVERVGRERVFRIEQPDIAQARNGATPRSIIEVDDRVGEAVDDRLRSERVDPGGARRPIEQADHLHDREQYRLAGEPFVGEGVDDASRLVVSGIVRIIDGRADGTTLAGVAAMQELKEAGEQAQRESVSRKIMS